MKLDAIVSAMFSLVIIAGVWCHFSPWFTVFPASWGGTTCLSATQQARKYLGTPSLLKVESTVCFSTQVRADYVKSTKLVFPHKDLCECVYGRCVS
ncbi:hypothetical protein CG394_00810 [Gardnerella vaginalis]|nr:hypothetical protein CYJ63_03690 [Gardnerella vaginalis]TCH81805.1 hypothetical protein E0E46_05010 [Gardnerella vaginalis ATCC 14018 = JCM 11026]PKZ74032.1 hypothetical protein CYJ65_01905 [Gardnerella vaginalis]PMC49483.1 hypothetical protein CJ212_01545 [Gardnerella vaginalis]PNP87798.1 hypothetical protein BFS12_01640 [Gardnerella vaginalis]